jgi:hypothetical protein
VHAVLLALYFVYVRYLELVGRIANIPRSNYGVVEDKPNDSEYSDTQDG